MAGPGTLSVCMIVRNEAHQLDAMLRTVRPIADEIVVVDTGSTDETPQIARAHTPLVFHFPWCDDFSAARNASLQRASKDYVLWLDADDELRELDQEKIRGLKEQMDGGTAFYFILKDEAPGGIALSAYQLRCVPNRPEIRFTGRVHEVLEPAVAAAGIQCHITDISVYHHGYRDPVLLRSKIERNLKLLDLEIQDGRDDEQILYYVGQSYAHLGRHREACGVLERLLAKLERFRFAETSRGERIAPYHLEALFLLAEQRLAFGDRRQAHRCVVKLTAMAPSDRGSLARLAQLHQRLNRHQDALECFNRAASGSHAVTPLFAPCVKDATIWSLSAYSLFCLGNEEAAEALASKAAGASPDPGREVWEGLGTLALRDGKIELAKRFFCEALERGGLTPDGYCNLGLIQKKEGHPEFARWFFENALREDPEHAPALTNLANWHLFQGSPWKAKPLYWKLVENGSRDLWVVTALAALITRRPEPGEIQRFLETMERPFSGSRHAPTDPQNGLLDWIVSAFPPEHTETLLRWRQALAARLGL